MIRLSARHRYIAVFTFIYSTRRPLHAKTIKSATTVCGLPIRCSDINDNLSDTIIVDRLILSILQTRGMGLAYDAGHA